MRRAGFITGPFCFMYLYGNCTADEPGTTRAVWLFSQSPLRSFLFSSTPLFYIVRGVMLYPRSRPAPWPGGTG